MRGSNKGIYYYQHHNREQSEYVHLFPVMSDTPGNPMSDDADLESDEDT
jgi:hypothetical protein